MSSGLGKLSRERLGALIRQGEPVITPTFTAKSLSIPRRQASHLLARWARAGWLARVKRGAYVPVPLQASASNSILEDPWIVATSLFEPCYVGGWSAAEHWGLTEQLFRSVCIVTAARPRNLKPELRGTRFSVSTTTTENFFGLKYIWRGRTRVQVSDPARTLVDMLNSPRLGGGIRSVADMLNTFLDEYERAARDLILYAERLGNGTVFKRLGFLLDGNRAEEIVSECRQRLTAGYSQLDPELPGKQLVTTWRLWVPRGWRKSPQNDRQG